MLANKWRKRISCRDARRFP